MSDGWQGFGCGNKRIQPNGANGTLARTDSQGDHVNPMNPAPETDFECAIDPGQNPNALNDLYLSVILIRRKSDVEHGPMISMEPLLRRKARRRGLQLFDSLKKSNPGTSAGPCPEPSTSARGGRPTTRDLSSELVV